MQVLDFETRVTTRSSTLETFAGSDGDILFYGDDATEFCGYGAAGRARLDRRISFAEQLQQDVGQLRTLCKLIKAREEKKKEDAGILRDIVETVYFPITPLLWPALEKAQRFVAPNFPNTVLANVAYRLDIKGLFSAGFLSMREKLSNQCYTSVSTFSSDFSTVVSAVLDARFQLKSPPQMVTTTIGGRLKSS